MPGATLGETTFVVSQSWLSTYLRCPAEAGHELRGEIPNTGTDATALGSAWHLYAEHRQHGMNPTDALVRAQWFLETEPFEWVQIKTMQTLQQRLGTLCDTFEEQIWPQLGETISIEQDFKVPLAETPDGTSIFLKGTTDREDTVWDQVDFKTASRTGEGSVWDKYTLKWKIQACAYTYAKAYTMTDGNPFELGYDLDFTFIVATKGPRPERVQWLTTPRGATDWLWLQHVATNALECARASVWPVNHTSHLCSPKWCGAWDVCRGAATVLPIPTAVTAPSPKGDGTKMPAGFDGVPSDYGYDPFANTFDLGEFVD